MTPTWFLDASVFIYAAGSEHRYRHPCRELLTAIGDGRLATQTSVLVVQEVLHQRRRRTGDRAGALVAARAVASMCQAYEVTPDDLARAFLHYAANAGLDAADALHAAVAQRVESQALVSADTGFAAIDGLTWLDPFPAAARLS